MKRDWLTEAMVAGLFTAGLAWVALEHWRLQDVGEFWAHLCATMLFAALPCVAPWGSAR